MQGALPKYESQTYTNKEEWLNARGIGGSSASAIVGVSPWETTLALYKKIINKNLARSGTTSDSKEYGTKCEPLIRDIFRLNHPTWQVNDPVGYTMYRSTTKPYLTATVDGTIVDENGRKGILEIKTHDIRREKDLADWSNGRIPANYLVQVIHYLLVLNDYDFVQFVAKLRYFDFDDDGARITREEIIYRNIERSDVENELAWLEKKETDFWENNVEKRIPPKVEITF